MEYLVACNWDFDLMNKIDFPDVKALFGGLPNSIIASGRPSTQIKKISDEDVKKYIKMVHDKKWTFDFNINSSCTANKELTVDGFKSIMKYLEWVSDLGVDAVTIMNTNLIKMVKKNFPKLKVNLSTFQKVTEVTQAQRFEDMGVDLIMLSEHINRDFKTLRAIRNAVKCKLTLVGNVGCIYDCPNAHTHANSTAHSGAKGENASFADPFMLYCFSKRLEQVDEVIKIRWIRPEDVVHYEDVGIDMLKIIDRYTKTEGLVARVKAYCDRNFDGNLITLLGQMIDSKGATSRAKEFAIKKVITKPTLASLKGLKKARDFGTLFANPLYDILSINNKKIPDDFIKNFMNRDCKTMSCKTCGYCNEVAKQSVEVLDKELLIHTQQHVKQGLESLLDGTGLY